MSELGLLPGLFLLIDDALIIFLFGYISIRNKLKIDGALFSVILLYLSFVSVSAILNDTLFQPQTIYSIRSFLYPIIFISLLNSKEGLIASSYKIVVNIMLIQSVIIVLQVIFYQYDPIINRIDTGFGTYGYGSSNILGILMSFTIYSLYSRHEKRIPILKIVILFIGLIFTFSKVAFITLALLFLVDKVYETIKNRSVTKSIYYLSVFAISVSSISFIYNNLVEYDSNSLLADFYYLLSADGIEKLFQSQLDEEHSGRLFIALSSLEALSNNVIDILFGWGPGNYTSYAGFEFNVERLNVWLDYFKDRSTRFDMEIVALVSEYGIIGTVIISAMYYLILRGRTKELNPKRYTYYVTLVVLLFTNTLIQTHWFSITAIIIALANYDHGKSSLRNRSEL